MGRAGHFDAAQTMLYQAAENVATEYKPRVFQELGESHYCKGDINAAVRLYLLAGKLGREHDTLVFLQSQQALAHIYGTNGDSSWCVKTLDSIFDSVLVAARTYPVLYHLTLNNYAARLGEVGRVDEANAALNIALNSRYAASFPEWGRTREELETKRRHPRPSFVALSSRAPRPVEPKPELKKRQAPKLKRRGVRLIVRALQWLAGLSAFTSFSSAPLLNKPIRVDSDAPFLVTSEWPTSGPGPRAPPSSSRKQADQTAV